MRPNRLAFWPLDFALIFLTMLTNILVNSPVSFLSAASLCSGINLDSASNSSQYSVSSDSCKALDFADEVGVGLGS